MKYRSTETIILLTMLACACSVSNTQIPSNQKLDEGFYTPPNTNELFVGDKQKKEYEIAKDEERQYWESIVKIEDKIRTEKLNLAICNEMAPNKNECGILKNNYCQVDMLLDTRGVHHKKDFCEKDSTHKSQ